MQTVQIIQMIESETEKRLGKILTRCNKNFTHDEIVLLYGKMTKKVISKLNIK